ncbi:MAG: HAD family hydrolase [Gemmatimonadaceae bacterium]|nr:HAD family hydrolase [Gemmatimonadaceae bacterium]
MNRPWVVLDRDGTIIVERNYLSDPGGVELLTNAAEGIRTMKNLGLAVIVVTNQSGVGRGRYPMSAVDRVNERVRSLLRAEDADVDVIYVCPHVPADECDCRKPAPGMVRSAARDLALSPAPVAVVGDKECDIGLGRAVGTSAILIRTGYGASEELRGVTADYIVDDLLVAADIVSSLLGREGWEHLGSDHMRTVR